MNENEQFALYFLGAAISSLGDGAYYNALNQIEQACEYINDMI